MGWNLPNSNLAPSSIEPGSAQSGANIEFTVKGTYSGGTPKLLALAFYKLDATSNDLPVAKSKEVTPTCKSLGSDSGEFTLVASVSFAEVEADSYGPVVQAPENADGARVPGEFTVNSPPR